MVGRVTLLTPMTCLPATKNVFSEGSTTSGPLTGCGSGTASGQIGTCTCPGGCQPFVSAPTPTAANTAQIASLKNFITVTWLIQPDLEGILPNCRAVLMCQRHRFA